MVKFHQALAVLVHTAGVCDGFIFPRHHQHHQQQHQQGTLRPSNTQLYMSDYLSSLSPPPSDNSNNNNDDNDNDNDNDNGNGDAANSPSSPSYLLLNDNNNNDDSPIAIDEASIEAAHDAYLSGLNEVIAMAAVEDSTEPQEPQDQHFFNNPVTVVDVDVTDDVTDDVTAAVMDHTTHLAHLAYEAQQQQQQQQHQEQQQQEDQYQYQYQTFQDTKAKESDEAVEAAAFTTETETASAAPDTDRTHAFSSFGANFIQPAAVTGGRVAVTKGYLDSLNSPTTDATNINTNTHTNTESPPPGVDYLSSLNAPRIVDMNANAAVKPVSTDTTATTTTSGDYLSNLSFGRFPAVERHQVSNDVEKDQEEEEEEDLQLIEESTSPTTEEDFVLNSSDAVDDDTDDNNNDDSITMSTEPVAVPTTHRAPPGDYLSNLKSVKEDVVAVTDDVTVDGMHEELEMKELAEDFFFKFQSEDQSTADGVDIDESTPDDETLTAQHLFDVNNLTPVEEGDLGDVTWEPQQPEPTQDIGTYNLFSDPTKAVDASSVQGDYFNVLNPESQAENENTFGANDDGDELAVETTNADAVDLGIVDYMGHNDLPIAEETSTSTIGAADDIEEHTFSSVENEPIIGQTHEFITAFEEDPTAVVEEDYVSNVELPVVEEVGASTISAFDDIEEHQLQSSEDEAIIDQIQEFTNIEEIPTMFVEDSWPTETEPLEFEEILATSDSDQGAAVAENENVWAHNVEESFQQPSAEISEQNASDRGMTSEELLPLLEKLDDTLDAQDYDSRTEEKLSASLRKTASSAFKATSNAYDVAREELRDSKGKSQTRLSRAEYEKRRSTEKITNLYSKFEKEKKVLESDLDSKLSDSQVRLDAEHSRTKAVLRSQIELEKRQEEAVGDLMAVLEEGILAKEKEIVNDARVVEELQNVRSKVKPGAIATQMDKLLQKKSEVAELDRALVKDITGCLNDLNDVYEFGQMRRTKIQITVDNLPRPLAKSSEPYNWKCIEDAELALETASSDLSKSEHKLLEIQTRIDEALLLRCTLLGDSVPKSLRRVAQKASAKEALKAVGDAAASVPSSTAKFRETLRLDDLVSKESSALYNVVTHSVGQAAVKSSTAAVHGVRAIVETALDRTFSEKKTEQKLLDMTKKMTLTKTKKKKEEPLDMAMDMLEDVGKAIEQTTKSEAAEVASKNLKESSNELLTTAKATAALGVKFADSMKEQFSALKKMSSKRRNKPKK